MPGRIWTSLYVLAVAAAAVAVFGISGLFWAAAVFVFWGYVYLPTASSSPMRRFVKAVVAILVLLLIVVMLLSTQRAARTPSRMSWHNNQMKQLQVAMLSYATMNGTLPPAYLADADGKPMHSWRVLILPYIEEQELYDKYDFDEPWNGPNNSKLKSQMPQIYISPYQWQEKAEPGMEANYFVVVGPETASPGAEGLELSNIPDGPRNTILLIEASEKGVDWMEPRDLTPAEAVDLLTAKPRWRKYDRFLTTEYYFSTARRSVGFADGHAQWIGQPADPEVARALLTIAGGETIPSDLRETYVQAQTHSVVKWGKVCALGIFVALAVLPVVRLKRRERPQKSE